MGRRKTKSIKQLAEEFKIERRPLLVKKGRLKGKLRREVDF